MKSLENFGTCVFQFLLKIEILFFCISLEINYFRLLFSRKLQRINSICSPVAYEN